MINQVDKDGNGQIDFVEFLEVIAQEALESRPAEEILAVFRGIDQKGLGYISSDDLRQILNHLDEPLSQEEVDEIISEIDKKGEGKIHFDDFFAVMMPDSQ